MAGTDRHSVLDGLRFLAALSVVLFHLLAVAGAPVWGRPSPEVFGEPAFFVASYGWVGVPVFFMISGFVICMSSWGRTVGEFGVSRVVRLYPAYWVCVLLTTLVGVLWPQLHPALPWRDVLLNLTMLHFQLDVASVDPVYWTLAVELQFYLIFAVAVVWRGVTLRRAIGFCVAWIVVAVWVPKVGQPWLSSLLLAEQAHYFIAGIVLFLIYRHGPHAVLWLLLAVSWVMAMHYYDGNVWQQLMGQPYAPASIATTLGYVVLTLLALHKLDWVRWRGLTALGATTYPLYLLHYVVGMSAIQALRRLLPPVVPPVVLLVGVVLVLVLLAWLVHRLVERPLAPTLRRLLQRPLTTTPVPAQREPSPS